MDEDWSEINGKALFKMLFWGYLGIYAAMSIFIAFLTVFGVAPVYFNGVPHTGLTGLAVVIAYIPLIPLVLAVTNWIVLSAGLWIYSRVVEIHSYR